MHGTFYSCFLFISVCTVKKEPILVFILNKTFCQKVTIALYCVEPLTEQTPSC